MKLFASDLDGTLLNKEHKADAIINQGLQDIEKAGHVFTVCTGRNLSLTRSAGLIDSYKICMNGACITDPLDTVLFSHPFDTETIALLLRQPMFSFEYQTLDAIYTSKDADTFREIYEKNLILRNRKIQKDMEKNLKNYVFNCTPDFILQQKVYKVNLHYADASMREKVDAFVSKHKDTIINAPSTTRLAELTQAGITKANAVTELAQYLQIDASDVYVYGDGINDIQMLERFDHSYCPKNGSAQAKQAANHLLDDFETYSVIRHMQEVIRE